LKTANQVCIHELEEQTIMRYLGRVEPKYANMVQLQQFTTFDEVCVLAHKVEQQKRWNLFRHEYPKMNSHNPYPLNKPSTRRVQIAYLQSLPCHQKSKPLKQTPLHRLNTNTFRKTSQDVLSVNNYLYTFADCTNRRVITFAEWTTMKEEEKTETLEKEQEEEVVVYPDEGDMLDLKPLLNIQKCNFHPHFETQTTSSPKEPVKNESFPPNMVKLRPYLNNRHLLNLRTNSFQQGDNDGDPPWGHP